NRTIDNLFKQGATVLYSKVAGVHVHGHGSQEELKMMLTLVRPKFFVPIHGEYRHLVHHVKLAQAVGVPKENAFVLENGSVLELSADSAKVVGKVPAGYVYVDGLGVGDIGQVVLRDRQALAQEGVVVVIVAIDKQTGKLVSRPDIVSRGFVFMKESEELIEQAKDVVTAALSHKDDHLAEWGFVASKVKDALSRFLYEQTKRRPMILPVSVEV
ncbi:MAG: ribonuclease J, partial [Dehalococcoidia bacterium]|nr:ribonuclease J [Dehalococcoidia bacterium]